MRSLFCKWVGLFSISCLCLFLVPQCSGDKPEEKSAPTPKPPVQKELSLGLIPEQDIFSQKKRYEPLIDYLSRKTGITIKVKVLSRYGNIIDNFLANELDAAFFGSFTGALAIKKLGVVPIARPESPDGTSTYYGLIFVRKDSGIKKAMDMKGRIFALVDKATTAGWLLPLHYFKQNGIDNCKDWLGEMYFAGTHEDAIQDVLNKKADIGAAKNTVFYRLARLDKRILGELEILATSPKVPENGLAVRQDLEESLRQKLSEALLQMERDPEGQQILNSLEAARFIATTAQDYAPVFAFAEGIGLDLAQYDYSND